MGDAKKIIKTGDMGKSGKGGIKGTTSKIIKGWSSMKPHTPHASK